MFESTSRYSAIDTATLPGPYGQATPFKRRRFLPPLGASPLLVEITVAQGDRLDVLTSRVLGDPEQFWRLCDENIPMNPFNLTAEVGAVLRVPVPGAWRPR